MRPTRTQPILTLPNALTLIRIPLAAALWIAPSSRLWLVTIVAVAALSDVFDGRFARAMRRRRLAAGEETEGLGEADALGAWLDPVCDKAFVLSLLAAIVVGFEPPLWIVPVTAIREITLIPLAIAYRFSPWLYGKLRFDFRAGWPGKATIVAQFAVAGAILYYPTAMPYAAITAGALGAFATIHYVRRAIHVARYVATNPVAVDFAADNPDILAG